MDSKQGGKANKDLGYLLVPEPGFVIDVADLASFQFGVPFSIVGKNASSYWGLHLSLGVGLSIL
jgi:hypothetical protein